VILVSHDRGILNAVATHILHLDAKKLILYPGDYDTFVRTRRERLVRERALASQQAQRRAQLQAFIDRFRAKASKARQAQSRVKALAKLEEIATPVEDPSITFDFPQPDELPPPLLTLDRVAVGYAPGEPVLRGLNLRLDPDDRIALLGANGNGKSTLAKLIAGRLQPQAGEATRSGKLRAGFFAQHQIEELDPRETPLDHMSRKMPRAGEAAVRALLGRFGFSQEKALVKAGDLSGGEKARLTLALVTYDAPPLLILDEPTNHLDIEAREALVAALGAYAGAVVLISHDWHLVSLAADRLWLVADGTARPFDGDLDDYRRHLAETRRGAAATSAEPAAPSRRDERRAAAERRKELEPLRRKAQAAERRVGELAAEKAKLDERLADPAAYAGADPRLVEWLRRQGELQRLIATAEADWLSAEEALEEAAAAQ
jgi:ATP-binding cassette subfamily F protein 3